MYIFTASMLNKKIKIKETTVNNNWITHTYFQGTNFSNRVHYSDGVFRCIEKIYYGGILRYHYSYVPNTHILDGEIITYE